MKTTVTLPAEKQDLTYPCLRTTIRGNVVLFSSEHAGTVVHSTKQCYDVGHHSEEWLSANDKVWTSVKSVTITN